MDAYPMDDRELFRSWDREEDPDDSAEAMRQRDYDDLIAALRLREHPDHLLQTLGTALTGELMDDTARFLADYAESYGWKQALRVVMDVLPSKDAA